MTPALQLIPPPPRPPTLLLQYVPAMWTSIGIKANAINSIATTFKLLAFFLSIGTTNAIRNETTVTILCVCGAFCFSDSHSAHPFPINLDGKTIKNGQGCSFCDLSSAYGSGLLSLLSRCESAQEAPRTNC